MALALNGTCKLARSQNPRQVTQGFMEDTTIAPGSTHDYALRLAAGESVTWL